jgi:hypothetical protein
MTHRNCIKCGALLVVGENTTQYRIDNYQYVCQLCKRKCDQEYQQTHREQIRERQREYYQEHREQMQEREQERNHRTGRYQPMSKNRNCPAFLGIYVAERVLAHLFKSAIKMPYGNPGYDFVCGGGHKIDVKSACRHVHEDEKKADNWTFQINKNKTAQHFLMLAFDNRDDLNPEHIWLIPANDVNDRVSISISETRLSNWSKYERDVEKVSTCCDVLKGDR